MSRLRRSFGIPGTDHHTIPAAPRGDEVGQYIWGNRRLIAEKNDGSGGKAMSLRKEPVKGDPERGAEARRGSGIRQRDHAGFAGQSRHSRRIRWNDYTPSREQPALEAWSKCAEHMSEKRTSAPGCEKLGAAEALAAAGSEHYGVNGAQPTWPAPGRG
jgi:hypothetical protein